MNRSPDERHKKKAHKNLSDMFRHSQRSFSIKRNNVWCSWRSFSTRRNILWCSHTLSLRIEKDLHLCQNLSLKFRCALLVCLFFSSGDFFISSVRVFSFTYHFCVFKVSFHFIFMFLISVMCD